MITPTQRRHRQRIFAADYLNFKVRLNRYANLRTHNTATADDLVQNTFLKTWKYLVKGGKIEIMEAFLFHVLKALIIDNYRKKTSTSLDVLIEKGFEPSIDESQRVVDIFDGKQIIDLIPKLPALYGKIIQMRYVQDLSLKEISLITGKTTNTIAVQAHRGLAKLKVLYEQDLTLKTSHKEYLPLHTRT